MSVQRWKHVAKRMHEACDEMEARNLNDAARIFNCLEHFALACADAEAQFPETMESGE